MRCVILKKIFCLGLVGLLSISVTACGNKNIATVNGVEITKDKYEKTKSILSYTNDYLNGESFDDMDKKDKKKIEETLTSFIIDNEIIYQEAKDKGFSPDKSEVESKYKEMQDNIDSNSGYKSELEKAGVDKEYLTNEITRDLTIEKYRKDFKDKQNISEKEIQDYYAKHKKEFKVQEVDASQILISTLDKDKKQVSDAEKEKLKQKADKVIADLEKGSTFEDLAKKYSDDKATGKNGGGLGYFTKDSKNAEFTKHVFSIDKGKTSDVFETSYGYHIVKINDKRDKELSFEDSREDIIKKIVDQKFVEHVNSLEKNAEIKK